MITPSALQKMEVGIHITVTASDEVETGLGEVLFVMAALASDPDAGAAAVTATIPDQVASPGKILVSSWQAGGPATTFEKPVRWLAMGR